MPLTPGVLELIAMFNRQKTDLPDGLVHKDCVFRLNGRAYHEQLGRPPADPLVKLVGCGAAGYRFILAALRYAVLEPHLALHEASLVEVHEPPGAVLRAQGALTGTLRSTKQAFVAEFGIEVSGDANGHVHEIAVTLGDADVELLSEARRAG